ncbi:MAG: sulfatase-like hydrolase/transferase [Chitinophagaceae bacterium]
MIQSIKQTGLARGPLLIILLCLFFVANGLNGIWNLVSLPEITILTLKLLAFAIPGIVFSALLYRQREKLWLMALFMHIYFLFSRSLFTAFREYITHLIFFICSGIVFIGIYFLLRRSSLAGILRLQRYLLLLFCVLIIYELLIAKQPAEPFQTTTAQRLSAWPGNNKPNIYVLVFDEYQGNHELQSTFNFDNSGLTDFLQQQGFTVAGHPRSTYNTTFYSMLSLFRMDTLDIPGPLPRLTQKGIVKANQTMAFDNTVTTYLKQSGYAIKVNSIFNVDDQPASGPTVTTVTWSQIQILRTFYGWCFDDLLTHIPSNRIQKKLQSLCARYLTYNAEVEERTMAQIGTAQQPSFVYSHFLLPHLPVLLDEQGREFRFSDAIRELNDFQPSILQTYPRQVGYANKVIMRLVQNITAKDPNAIIILLSDHGCRNVMGFDEGVFSTQWAMKIPGKKITVPKENLHMVNTFRILFNELAGQQLPMIPPSSRVID